MTTKRCQEDSAFFTGVTGAAPSKIQRLATDLSNEPVAIIKFYSSSDTWFLGIFFFFVWDSMGVLVCAPGIKIF